MANGKLTLGKQSGGVLSLTFPDGSTNTEVVLPESGTVITDSNYATETTGGTVKIRYDNDTQTLYIRTDGTDA